jgi:hypothetical protein
MARKTRSTQVATLTKLAELSVAAPQVVAVRTARMLAAGANPRTADRAEFSRMHTEKVEAFWESMFGMAAQAARANQEVARSAAMQWWRMCTTPWALAGKGGMLKAATALIPVPTSAQSHRAASSILAAAVKPVHKRATANARRLTAPKRRKR